MNAISYYNELFTILFLLLAGAAIAMNYVRRQTAKTEANENAMPEGGTPKDVKKEELIFFGMLFLAFLLRIWKFGLIPGGMNQDGAMAAVDAKALADYGTDRFGTFLPTHFEAWGFAQMNVFMSYCMVPFFKLFGMNVVTTRLPVLLFSMLGLVALYFVGRRLLDVRGAQILLAFAACNPWHFMQSRWALESNMLPHVFLIGFCLLLMGLEGKKRWLYLSMIFFALCMYCYGIAFYTVPVFLIFMAGDFLIKKLLKWWEIAICVLLYVLISWPIYLTMAINAFGWKTMRTFFCTMPYFKDSIRSKDILFFSDNVREQLVKNLEAVKRVYLEGDGLPWNSMNGIGVMAKCFLPFVLLGLIACVSKLIHESDPRKKAGQVALLAFFVIANLSGIITAQVNVNRINFLHYSLLILVAYGICYCIQGIPNTKYLILASYLILSFLFLGTYFTKNVRTLEKSYYHDFLDAVWYVGDKEVSNCTKYVITPDTQYTGSKVVSEILTMFALDVDARYYQGFGVDENGLAYAEKFRYVNFTLSDLDPDAPVAFVFKTIMLTPEVRAVLEGDGDGGYEVTSFGDYCAAIPRNCLKGR